VPTSPAALRSSDMNVFPSGESVRDRAGVAVRTAGRLDVRWGFIPERTSRASTRATVGFGEADAWRWIAESTHWAARTLEPVTAGRDLVAHGVTRVWLVWRRGGDLGQLDPGLRRGVTPGTGAGRRAIVGYVGARLRKHVDLFNGRTACCGVRVGLVGDGPAAPTVTPGDATALFPSAPVRHATRQPVRGFRRFVHTEARTRRYARPYRRRWRAAYPVVATGAGGPATGERRGRPGYAGPPGKGSAIAEAVTS